MTSYLFRFQIGPVQSFIAQARRTKDLYVGSRMLSDLAAAGVTSVVKTPGFQAVFPVIDKGVVYRGVSSHVFSFVADSEPQDIAHQIKDAIQTRWMNDYASIVRKAVKDVVGGGEWEETFNRQAAPFPTATAPGWMEFYWVAVPYDAHSHGAYYTAACDALAQRKMLRHFPQVNEPGIKCSLTGSQLALFFGNPSKHEDKAEKTKNEQGWEALQRKFSDIVLRPNEKLGTLALIKRLTKHLSGKPIQFLSTRAIAADNPALDQEQEDGEWEENPQSQGGREVEGYFAVLHMDGDKMGEGLGKIQEIGLHQEVSKALAEFAKDVAPDIIKSYGGKAGQLVYAGGDDVLALIPLKAVLKCADEMQKAFVAHIARFNLTNKKGNPITMSAGIAITPAKLPLDQGLEMARDAEHAAKEKHGRNAIAVTEAHGTSQREAGAKWDDLEHVLKLQDAFQKSDKGIRVLSGKFPYDLMEIAHQMQGGDVTAAMRESIMRRALRRRLDDKLEANKDEWVDYLAYPVLALAEPNNQPRWHDATNWAILARFLASGGTREDEA